MNPNSRFQDSEKNKISRFLFRIRVFRIPATCPLACSQPDRPPARSPASFRPPACVHWPTRYSLPLARERPRPLTRLSSPIRLLARSFVLSPEFAHPIARISSRASSHALSPIRSPAGPPANSSACPLAPALRPLAHGRALSFGIHSFSLHVLVEHPLQDMEKTNKKHLRRSQDFIKAQTQDVDWAFKRSENPV